MNRSQYNIWSEKKLNLWFEETSASEQEMLRRNAEGFDFTADIVANATEEDWNAAQKISKKWKQKNLGVKRAGLKWWLLGGGIALILGVFWMIQPQKPTDTVKPEVLTQPSPVPNLPKHNALPEIPQAQSTQSTQSINQDEIIKTESSDVEKEDEAKKIEESTIKTESISKKVEKPAKDQIGVEKKKDNTANTKKEVVKKEPEIIKVAPKREIREITIMEKVGDGDKNKRYAMSDLVSYSGGKEVLKGELYDKLKDEMSTEDIPESARSVVFEFWVNHNGKIQDVQVMSRISKKLEDKIIEAVNELEDWMEGDKKIDVGYSVYVTFY
jgi:hypothetical protein